MGGGEYVKGTQWRVGEVSITTSVVGVEAGYVEVEGRGGGSGENVE